MIGPFHYHRPGIPCVASARSRPCRNLCSGVRGLLLHWVRIRRLVRNIRANCVESEGYSVDVLGQDGSGDVAASRVDGWSTRYPGQRHLNHRTADPGCGDPPGGRNRRRPCGRTYCRGPDQRDVHAAAPRPLPVRRSRRTRVPPDATGRLLGNRASVDSVTKRAAAEAGWKSLPMTDLITLAAASIIGADRLHPTVTGHRALAITLRTSSWRQG